MGSKDYNRVQKGEENFEIKTITNEKRQDPLTKMGRHMDHKLYKAPDGGYGWVVVFCSFMLQAISGGIAFSVGIYFVEFLETFGQGKGETAWIGSINTGILFGAGPIASILANRFGHRPIIILGGFMSSMGILMSSFATDIYYLYFSYGLITGFGFCFTYVPSVVIVGFFFERRRNLAMGIAAAGFGAGNFIFAPILRGIVQIFGWRGAMILTSGFSLNCCVLGALMCPVSYWSKASSEISLKAPSKDRDDDSYMRQLANLFNISLLQDVKFMCFLLNNVLWNIGSLILLHLCPDYAFISGISKNNGAILISTLGGCSLLGRIAIAILGSHRNCDRFIVFIVSTGISGFAILLFPVYRNMLAFSIWTAVYGLSFGIQVGVLAVVTAELFGVERLTSAYGYLMFGNGAGAMLGPPIAGWIYEATLRYDVAFYFGGSITILSAIILILIPILQCREKRHADIDGKGVYYLSNGDVSTRPTILRSTELDINVT